MTSFESSAIVAGNSRGNEQKTVKVAPPECRVSEARDDASRAGYGPLNSPSAGHQAFEPGLEPDLPEPGDNFVVVDLKAVGVRSVTESGQPAVQFGITTNEARSHPNYPAGFGVEASVIRLR